MRRARGYPLLATALVACPCHLPLLAVLLAGTAAGGWLVDNLGLLTLGLAASFIVALAWGLRLVGQRPEASKCPSCEPAGAGEARATSSERTMVPGRR